MKPYTHFVVTIQEGPKHSNGSPLKLRGKTHNMPNTFGFLRDVLNVRYAYPFKSSIIVNWSHSDGTDNPPVAEGVIYH